MEHTQTRRLISAQEKTKTCAAALGAEPWRGALRVDAAIDAILVFSLLFSTKPPVREGEATPTLPELELKGGVEGGAAVAWRVPAESGAADAGVAVSYENNGGGGVRARRRRDEPRGAAERARIDGAHESSGAGGGRGGRVVA